MPCSTRNEVWQDTIVNIYRYPDRFLANRGLARSPRGPRPSSTTRSGGTCVAPSATSEHVALRDPGGAAGAGRRFDSPEPSLEAQNHEECRATATAFSLLLQAYLVAFSRLGERERFVLQMVEVRRMRYAETGEAFSVSGRRR